MSRPGAREAEAVDAAYQRALSAATRAGARQLVAELVDEAVLAGVLRRAVPVALLEEVAANAPWRDRPRVLALVVLNPHAPRELALRLVGVLGWRDLAEVALTLRISAAVRFRAESLLRDGLPDMRLGDRVSLARLATPALLPLLLVDAEPLVVEAALQNPRLREADLVTVLRGDAATRVLIDLSAAAPRWRACYAVRLALVLQPRTPLCVALLQVSGLVPRDLQQVAQDVKLPALVRLSAERVLGADG